MTTLLDFTLRTSVVLSLTLAAAWTLRRHSAARRHLVLSAGIVAALAVGPLSLLVPPLAVHRFEPAVLDAPARGERVAEIPATGQATALGITWRDTAAPLWLAGSLARGVWLAWIFVRLRRQTREARPVGGAWPHELAAAAADMGIEGRVTVLAAVGVKAPSGWGWRRPTILVPVEALEWDRQRIRVVLLHELAHVRRRDWPIQMLGEVLAVVSWFNPVATVVRGALRRESELACDDLVLGCGVPASAYGAELALFARAASPVASRTALLSMAHPSSLERRITAMLDSTVNRRPLSRQAILACCAAAFAATMPLAALQLVAQDEPGSFTVQVFDPSGAVLPGVAVEIEDSQQGKRSTATEGSGRAVFAAVTPGTYTISASVAGFRSLRTPITVRDARDRRRSITLQVAELSETVTVVERRPAAVAAQSAAALVEPLRVGGNIRTPRKLVHVAPQYPASMREAGLEGIVPAEVLIGVDGNVLSVRVLSADVHPEFARSAVEAVSRWQFSPTLLNGDAVQVRMGVSVRFNLED